MEELLHLKMEAEKRKGQRLFYALYPDEATVWDGPTVMNKLMDTGQILPARRDYPNHLEFFRAGARYRERAFRGGNRCITPWTFLETPAQSVLSAEAWTAEDATVLSLVDGFECVARPQDGCFLGIEPAFRVILDNGRFFDCSRRHRVLTSEGWLSLDQLVFRASGLRCWHRLSDYQASCVAGGHLGDRPLRRLGDIDLEQPPLRADVLERCPLVFVPGDEVEQKLGRIRACRDSDRLSTPDDLRRFADLFALFAGPSTSQSVLQPTQSSQAVRQLADALGARFRSISVELRGQSAYEDRRRDAFLTEFLDGPCRLLRRDAIRQSRAQLCDVQFPAGSLQELSRDDGRMAIFYPFEHPELVGGRKIDFIVPIGYQPIIDAHVPKTNNYKAAGVWHHNSGKTICGGYECSAHLTGLYPDWWEGRRFERPIAAWAAGKTNETTRDVVQGTLLGEVVPISGARKIVDGCGLIPGDRIGRLAWKSGVPDLVDTVKIRHVSGGWSDLGFKAYQQDRGSFEGTGRHVIWFDEEPPMDVYGEALIRTATTGGMVYLTFTPLLGRTEVVKSFMVGNDGVS